MRIGCLQFAPRLGDLDGNLTSADAVIAAADTVHEKQSVLDTLDLLVLPELAFSGESSFSACEQTH
jgi:protein N-terminal amidase